MHTGGISRKVFSILMAIVICMSLVPSAAFGQGSTDDSVQQVIEQTETEETESTDEESQQDGDDQSTDESTQSDSTDDESITSDALTEQEAEAQTLEEQEAELQAMLDDITSVSGLDALSEGLSTVDELASDVTGFTSGSGTETDPYIVSSAEELAYISTQVAAGNSYSGVWFELKHDIDLEGVTWQPIGLSLDLPFSGNLDGRGYSITNMSINGTSYLGLFGYSNGATIMNLTVEGTITASGEGIGGFSGRARNSTFINCISKVDITGQGRIIGGIVGYDVGGNTISYCGNEGDLSSVYQTDYVMWGTGGITGYSSGTVSQTVISYCYNTGEMSTYAPTVGGLVGYASGDGASISYSYSTGNVTSYYTGSNVSYGGVGGFIGRTYNSYTTITNCYSSGTVTAPSSSTPYVGSFIGNSYNTVTSSTSYTNCWGVSGDYEAIGSSSGSYSVTGKVESISIDDMKAGSFATTLGEYFVAREGDLPILTWQDESLTFDITVGITYDDDSNVGNGTPSITISDRDGEEIEPNDGVYKLSNGIYRATVKLEGYEDAVVDFMVLGSSFELPVEMTAIRYTYELTVSPADAVVTLSDLSSSQTIDPADIQTTGDNNVVYIYELVNGEYWIDISSFYYQTHGELVTISYADDSKTINLQEAQTFTATINVTTSDNSSFSDDEPVVTVFSADNDGNREEVVYQGTGANLTPALPAGNYIVDVRATGYTAVIEEIAITNSAVTINIVLEPAGAWDGSVDTGWYIEGELSYTIRNAAELAGLSQLVADGVDFSNTTIYLATDIDLNNNSWTPIGTYKSTGTSTPFSGTFNGQGHTISNMMINSSTLPIGLFGFVQNGTVQNLTVTGSVTTSAITAHGTAGIIGRTSYSLVENCVSEVSVSGRQYIGGIVGNADYGTTIRSCTNKGTINGTNYYIGGIVGIMYDGLIQSCTNIGDVASTGGTSGSGYCVGGIVGRASYGTEIRNSSNSGTIEGYGGINSSSGTGGIAGSLQNSSSSDYGDSIIYGCFNTGTITGPATCAGGIVGGAGSTSTSSSGAIYVEYCYNLGTINTTNPDSSSSSTANAGGIIGVASSSVRMNSCYNAGVIDCGWLESGYLGALIGNSSSIRYSNTAYVSSNYALDAGLNCFGLYGGNATNLTGCGELVSEEDMKTQDFVDKLGGDYAITDNTEADFYNDGYPYLLWQDPDASYDVTLALSYDTEANLGDTNPTITIYDSENSPVAQSNDGATVFNLDNGTYSATIELNGYNTANISFTVDSSSITVDVSLIAITYTITATVSPQEAEVVLLSQDGETIEPASTVEGSLNTTYTWSVYNGTYELSAQCFGYYTESTSVEVSYTDPETVTLDLEEIDKQEVTFSVESESGGFGETGPVLQIFDEDTGILVYFSREDDSVQDDTTVFTFELPEGTYIYDVRAASMDGDQNNITVSSENYQFEVTLSEHASWGGTSDIDESWASASIDADTYYIGNGAELAQFAYLVRSGTDFSGKTVVLLGDIDLASNEWSSIGYYSSGTLMAFRGTFDGGGYAINGISMSDGAGPGIGLFGATENATITSLVTRGSITVTYGSSAVLYAGGIVAYAGGSSVIDSCGNEVNLDVTNSYSESNSINIGGIAGWMVNASITNSYNTGNVRGGASQVVYVGGLVGFMNCTVDDCVLNNVYNQANITATSATSVARAGGLVGSQGGTITSYNIYNTGTISIDSSPTNGAAGALFGSVGTSYTVIGNAHYLEGSADSGVGAEYSNINISTQEQTSEYMTSQDFVTELGDAYVANGNGGYPLLSWQNAVKSIEVDTMPDKTSYEDMEDFDDTGMIITVYYENGGSVDIESGWVVLDGRNLAPGTTYVTIDYHGATVEVPITVTQIEHTITDDLELDIAVPVAGETPQTTIDTGSDLYTATIEWTRGGETVTGDFEADAYYRAQVTLSSYYVDGDAWWVFEDDASPSAEGSYDTLYTNISDDLRTITVTFTYEPTGDGLGDIAADSLHLYYEGDDNATSIDAALERTISVTVGGSSTSWTIAEIEQMMLEGDYITNTYTYIENGSTVTSTLAGVSLHELMIASDFSQNADPATEITMVDALGNSYETTWQDIANGGNAYVGTSTSYVSTIIAVSENDTPLRSMSSLLPNSHGPAMIAFGQDSATDADSVVFGVSRIVSGEVTDTQTQTVTFNVMKDDQALSGATIEILDANGNKMYSQSDNPYVFTLPDAALYTYTVSMSAHTAFTGSFELLGSDVTIDVTLQDAWDGYTLVEPQMDDEGYYLIGTPEELMWWNANMSRSDKVKLTADIAIGDTVHYDESTPLWDCSGSGSSESNAFTGIFDGQGYTISGLYIVRENTIEWFSDNFGSVGMISDRVSAVGLFGYANGATIKNLGVVGKIYVVDRPDSSLGDYMHVGGIVGFATANTTISNCYANVSIAVEQASGSGNYNGYPIDGWPLVCDVYVGGIAGSIGLGCSIDNSYSRGSLAAEGTRSISIGGIAGAMRASTSNATVSIQNCYSTASITAYPATTSTGFYSYLGGIVGNSNVFGTTTTSTTSTSTILSRDWSIFEDGQDGPVVAEDALEALVLSEQEEDVATTMAGTVTLTGNVALNRYILGNDLDMTQAGRVTGSSSDAIVSNNLGLSSMSIEGVRVLSDEACNGDDITATESRFASTYTSLGWDTDIWQLGLGTTPLLSYQDQDKMIDEYVDDFYPGTDTTTVEDEGTFGTGAPPSRFTLNIYVAGHSVIQHKVYTSTEMRVLAASDDQGVIKYSSYSAAGAAGRVATEYVFLETLLADAGIEMESGDSLVMGGTYSYDTYFADSRYYYPYWNTYSSEGAIEVPATIVLRSYGSSSGMSDAYLDMYAAQSDYLWAYVLNFGQTYPTEATYSNFIYQQTQATVRLDATDSVDDVILDYLNDAITAAQSDLNSTTVGTSESDVETGTEFVTSEDAAALSSVIAEARKVASSSSTTNDEAMASYEALLAAIDTFDAAKKTGTKAVDLSTLEASIDLANELLDSLVAAAGAEHVDVGTWWISGDLYEELQEALELANLLLSDSYMSQSAIDEAARNLAEIAQQAESTMQQGTHSASDKWIELYGETRYDTMSEIIDQAFSGMKSDTVIIASGKDYPDALSASAIAGAYDAPVVLTNNSELSTQARLQIESLDPSRVIIVGGESSVTPAVVEQISDIVGTGCIIERLAGSDRAATSVAVAEKISTISDFDTAFIVSATAYADALSISPVSYAGSSPIFLTGFDGVLSEATLEAIVSNSDIENVVILGGSSAVSSTVESQITSADSSITVSRLAGSDRFETSTLIAKWAIENGASVDGAVVTYGYNYPDGLAASALAGRNGSVLLLASSGNVTAVEEILSMSSSNEFSRGYFVGGTAVITEEMKEYIRALTN